MTTNNFKLLILDFDGTVAKTLNDVVFCMGKTFEKNDLPKPDYLSVLSTVGLTLEDSFQALCEKPIAPNQISKWVNTYRTIYKEEGGKHTRLFPSMKEAIKTAHERGIKILVVSNKGMLAIKDAVAKLGIDKYIDQILSGDEVTHKKPNPKLFHSEIKPLYPTIKNNEILVVGDTKVDISFANNAKLQSCWVTYGYGKKEECLALKPTYTIDKASELISIATRPIKTPVPKLSGYNK